MSRLTHFDEKGQPHMVDVSDKPATSRVATAEGYITMAPDTLQLIRDKGHKKGDVLSIAQLAGIMAAKKTDALIPLCHPLPLSHVSVELSLEDTRIHIISECPRYPRLSLFQQQIRQWHRCHTHLQARVPLR